MNGYEVSRKIKFDPKTKNVAVIMCSVKREDWDRYWEYCDRRLLSKTLTMPPVNRRQELDI